jgi:hypothetical protein
VAKRCGSGTLVVQLMLLVLLLPCSCWHPASEMYAVRTAGSENKTNLTVFSWFLSAQRSERRPRVKHAHSTNGRSIGSEKSDTSCKLWRVASGQSDPTMLSNVALAVRAFMMIHVTRLHRSCWSNNIQNITKQVHLKLSMYVLSTDEQNSMTVISADQIFHRQIYQLYPSTSTYINVPITT